MDREIYAIVTRMEPEDYRKFLYITTFFKDKSMVVKAGLLGLVGALIVIGTSRGFNVGSLILWWIFMIFVVVVTYSLKIENAYKRRIKTDRTGMMGSPSYLTFYEDRLKAAMPAFDAENSLEYDKFYRLLETKDYYIFYYNANLASILRKKDVKDPEYLNGFLMTKFQGRHKLLTFI